MSAYYCVIQCSPGLTGECINIGVVTYDNEQILYKFLENWNRVEAFESGGIDYLREFAVDAMAGKIFPTIQSIEYAAINWQNSIRLTPPRGSLLNAADLLERIAHTFLVEHETEGRVGQ